MGKMTSCNPNPHRYIQRNGDFSQKKRWFYEILLLFRLIARPRALTAKAAAERKAEIDRLADGLYNLMEEEMEMGDGEEG